MFEQQPERKPHIMSDISHDELLSLFVEAGFPAPMAQKFVLAIQGESDDFRRQLFDEARRDPRALREAMLRVAEETIDNGAQYLFPTSIVARHDDGTFDLELDLKSDFFRRLHKNLQTIAEMIGLELKEGVRFYNVPGVEDHPIDKSHTTATIGFKNMDIAKPYAVPPLVIIAGDILSREAPAIVDNGKIEIN